LEKQKAKKEWKDRNGYRVMPDGLIHAAGKTFDTTGKEIFENEQTEL